MIVRLECFNCHKTLEFVDRVGRRDECPFCHADAHSCRNCQHYDAKAYNECREPAADRVTEKERANYCDHFTPRTGATGAADARQNLLSAAEALFRKK